MTTNLAATIDGLLTEARPPRYEHHRTWAAPIVAKIHKLIPDTEHDDIIRSHAARLVANRERAATGQANKFLRRLKATQQLPLFWEDLAAAPIIVDGERIRLDEANRADLIQFDATRRKVIEDQHAASINTLDGALWLAEQAATKGVSRVWDALTELPRSDIPLDDDDQSDDQ